MLKDITGTLPWVCTWRWSPLFSSLASAPCQQQGEPCPDSENLIHCFCSVEYNLKTTLETFLSHQQHVGKELHEEIFNIAYL